jgi:K+-sensing histidine kinase KdpD
MLSSGQDLTKRKNEEKIQQVIADILDASNTESDLNEFFKFIHKSISKLMLAENFYIALYDKISDMISFPYSVDKYDPAAPPQKLGKGLTEYVLRLGKPLLVTKEIDDELVRKGETELVGAQSAIWLGIPLKIADLTIGVLVVQDYENEETYTEKEQHVLEVIAYSISRTIERIRLEAERRDLIKNLERLNTSKDKLFSLISHDLRSPFNSLLGFSEILTNEYESLTPEEIKEYIRAIYDSSKNLYGMTSNLLQYSRFQTGKIDFTPTNLNLKKVVNECLKLLKGNIVKKQLSVIDNVSENLYVFADGEMLLSIIQNILSNAIKFTYKKGDIKISSSVVSNGKDEGMVNISVEDSGIGITDADLKRIMDGDPYTNPGTEKEFGTGLGLQLVKDFIAKNGGKLNIKSKLNMGSTFSFTIPLSK